MDSKTFHNTPLSFWFLAAIAIVIAELCVIYLAMGSSTSHYVQPGRAASVQPTAQYSTQYE